MRSKSRAKMDEIAAFANQYYLAHGHSPSTTAIAAHVGMARGTAYKYRAEMNRLGLIRYDGETISTAVTQKHNPDFCLAERVGSIRCGSPEEEAANVDEYVTLPVSVFGKGEFYLLRAKGDSMNLAGVDEGDLLVVEKAETAALHEIVVALDENGGNTLKRLEYDASRGRYFLQAESSNPENRNLYPAEISIQGVTKYVIKQV